jgi:precorrin-3B synthase
VLNGKASDAALAAVPAGDLVPAIQRLGALLRQRRTAHETTKNLIDRTAPAIFVSAYQGQQ